jgi:hypothetical protein
LETLLNYLAPRAKESKDSLTHFMLNHSAIQPRNMEEVVCMGPEGDRYYSDMDRVGAKMQSYLSECYNQFTSAFQPLLEGQPEEVLSKISKSKEVVTRTIEHRITFCDSSKQALQLALAAFDDQWKIIKKICKEQNRGN